MFFPRFSTRSLLALMGLAAAAFFVLGMAAEGYVWAGAASVVIVAGCVVGVIHAALFALVWLLSQLLGRRLDGRLTPSDPFAQQPYPLPSPSLAERIETGAAQPVRDAAAPRSNPFSDANSDGAEPTN